MCLSSSGSWGRRPTLLVSFSPAEFVNALIHGFGETSLGIDDAYENTHILMKWKDVDFAVCSAMMVVSSDCSSMFRRQRQRAAASMRTIVVCFVDADAAAAAYYIATADFIGVSRRTRRSDAASDAVSCVNETNKS
ncbi:hypothetical protein F2Q70_00022799 [Brassica cretica]|uniref:Uncharacterized protein n=1 Tax=Brassica cretica TaxID=69181 RepID=A0A8S9GLP0_BRACR|nr:hypothetical protein F2Q70_00022799 [Brassica cretica]KAF2555743.1 hypothetical protein F2Q68_00017066 [Brassica cretica]